MQSLSVNERVRQIKNSEEEINRFVEEYKPFIASCVEKSVGRYVNYGVDDELSIGLLAFVEAIKSYNIIRGSFLSFSRNVIKRRLIDYFRKEKKHNNVVYMNEYSYTEEGEEKDLSINESIEKYEGDQVNQYRRLELLEFKKELFEWDISFSDLVEASPKHIKTKSIYNDIIAYIRSQSSLTSVLFNKKYLPISDIEKGTGIPRKKIERARKYIIAVMIIIKGDYQYIRDYIDWEAMK